MSTTTFAEFYSIVSTSLQRKLLYHRTTILTSVFFITSLKIYVKNMHPVGCMLKIIFCLVKINLRNDRLQRFEAFLQCLV